MLSPAEAQRELAEKRKAMEEGKRPRLEIQLLGVCYFDVTFILRFGSNYGQGNGGWRAKIQMRNQDTRGEGT